MRQLIDIFQISRHNELTEKINDTETEICSFG